MLSVLMGSSVFPDFRKTMWVVLIILLMLMAVGVSVDSVADLCRSLC